MMRAAVILLLVAPATDCRLRNDGLPADVGRVLTDYQAAWQRRDPHALASLFASDGYVLANERPPVQGRDAIEHAYSGAGGPLSLHVIEYAVDEHIGYIIGGYSREPGSVEIGKFTLTLRKAPDGRWLIFSDMDNLDRNPHSLQ